MSYTPHQCLNDQIEEAGMVKAFDTYRTEQKHMQQRNVKEKRNLEENVG